MPELVPLLVPVAVLCLALALLIAGRASRGLAVAALVLVLLAIIADLTNYTAT